MYTSMYTLCQMSNVIGCKIKMKEEKTQSPKIQKFTQGSQRAEKF